jgi:hypothetical protein
VPLPLEYISSLQNGELTPVGMDDKQWTELPNGSKQTKFCLTHDQSFNTASGMSENERVLTEKLEPLYYGGCLSRDSLPKTTAPFCENTGGKLDIKAAYRRSTLQGNTAKKCSIMFKDFGLTSLQLPFGCSPCQNEFCLASELCADLANDILHSPDWDPQETKSPHADSLDSPKYLPEDLPFIPAQCLNVELPPDDWGRIDDFIVDGIAIISDLGENSKQAIQAMLLAIHILFRPVDTQEQIT